MATDRVATDREYGRLYPVAKAVVKPVTSLLWRINVSGLHHVPTSGPAIFCPNHISFFDSIVLPAVLPRRISYVGKAEYMDSWKTRYVFPAVGMIPIDRGGGTSSRRALDTAARVLNRGEFFGIYPEGTRSRDGKLHKGHTGPARLALETGAPIIPVGLRGTDLIQPAGAAVPRPFRSCQVNIGAPIDPARYADRGNDRMALRQLIDEVMFEIRRLSGLEYVDTYAGKGEAEPVAPSEVAAVEATPAVERATESEPEPEVVEVIDLPERAEREPVRTKVLVTAGGDGVLVDDRPSSADVLAKWWS